MTTTISTLIIHLEAQVNSNKPVYKEMQKLLKTLRDKHMIDLGCSLNKNADVLKQECQRIVDAFCYGTLQEKQQSTTKAKSTSATPTTHTIDKQEPIAPVSQPKQVAVEQQLAEAQATIADLRRQLADKTNEVAEYAEALSHAQDTIKQQRQTIDTLRTVEVQVEEPTIEDAVAAVADGASDYVRDETLVWEAANDAGLHMTGNRGNYKLKCAKTGLMLENKLWTLADVLDRIESYRTYDGSTKRSRYQAA